jgi:hypothetical protein
MYRAYYPVDNPSEYWKISLCIVFLDHLVEKISKRIVFPSYKFIKDINYRIQVDLHMSVKGWAVKFRE